jgi:hypothetical protein
MKRREFMTQSASLGIIAVAALPESLTATFSSIESAAVCLQGSILHSESSSDISAATSLKLLRRTWNTKAKAGSFEG